LSCVERADRRRRPKSPNSTRQFDNTHLPFRGPVAQWNRVGRRRFQQTEGSLMSSEVYDPAAEAFAPGSSMVYARSEFPATVLRWRRAGCGRCGKGQLRATQRRAVCPLKVTSSSCICARLQRKRRLASRSCGDIVGVSADACECRTAQVSRAVNSYQLLVVSGSAWVLLSPRLLPRPARAGEGAGCS
jgi:hypothetical protein